jgi:hypothetical protein
MGDVFKFSKIAETGTRVPRNTHAPLTLPGMLSTAGHCDQSRLLAMICAPAFRVRQIVQENEPHGNLETASLDFHAQ